MSSLNKVQLIGYLGKDPDIRHLDSGVSVANFSLATSERYTSRSGEKIETTDWHNIVVWGKLSEVVEKYVVKGMLVYVEGKLKTRSWEDKDGNKRYTTEVYIDSLQMLSNPARNNNQQTTQTGTPVDTFNPPNGDDDLPF